MKRLEIGLAVLLALTAVTTSCRRPVGTCCNDWSGPVGPVPARAVPAVQPPDPRPPAEPTAEPAAPVRKAPKSSAWQAKRVRGLTWENTSLGQAVAYLRTVTGKDFMISPKVVKDTGRIVMNLQLDDVTVKDVLGLITEPWELRWEERDGVVWILAALESAEK